MKARTGLQWWAYLSICAVILALSSPVSALETEKIELVEVHVQIIGAPDQPVLAARVNRAVSEVAQRALVGRPIAEVVQFAGYYLESLREVYNSTITGYTLEQLDIVPGRTCLVQAVLRPVGLEIRQVEVGWVFTDETLPGWVRADFAARLSELIPQLKQLYAGVPLASLSWAGQALSTEAKAMLPQIPGFSYNLTAAADRRTKLTIMISPEAPRIYEIKLNTYSHTLPPVLLRTLRSSIRAALADLPGLPVAYANQELGGLEERLSNRLTESESARQAGLSYQVRLSPAPVTVVDVTVESEKYKLRWEGEVNFGHPARPALHLEAGRFLNSSTRVLADLQIPVSSLSPNPGLGLGVHVLNGDLALVYSLAVQKPELRFEYELDRDHRVRLKRDWHTAQWELAYGLRQTDYLTMEVVGNSSGVWVRLVGSL